MLLHALGPMLLHAHAHALRPLLLLHEHAHAHAPALGPLMGQAGRCMRIALQRELDLQEGLLGYAGAHTCLEDKCIWLGIELPVTVPVSPWEMCSIVVGQWVQCLVMVACAVVFDQVSAMSGHGTATFHRGGAMFRHGGEFLKDTDGFAPP
eukprot:524549-Pelagomonas_calceolata.AAC.1